MRALIVVIVTTTGEIEAVNEVEIAHTDGPVSLQTVPVTVVIAMMKTAEPGGALTNRRQEMLPKSVD